jgi:CheY-like chemotaxis protein
LAGNSETTGASGHDVLDILVAEDNEVNQRVIYGMLKNLGHRITMADNGRIAVEVATSRRFDLVLMDVHMPELDGVAAMHELKAHLGDACPPILAMTAHSLAGDREHYLNEGMDDYISKPIRKAELIALLERNSRRAVKALDRIELPFSAAAVDDSSFNGDSHPLPVPGNNVEGLPILDTEQLDDLRYLPASNGEGADDAVGGLLRLFQSKGIERMAIVARCLADADWAQLAETAHSLRGASASMGFPRVASRCKDLELRARQHEKAASAGQSTASAHDELAEIFTSIQHYYREADIALEYWLKQDQPAGSPVSTSN